MIVLNPKAAMNPKMTNRGPKIPYIPFLFTYLGEIYLIYIGTTAKKNPVTIP